MRRGAAALVVVAGLAGCRDLNRSGDLRALGTGDLSNPPAERRKADEDMVARCPVTINGAGVLRRQPYLQQVTDQSARLLWTATHGPTAKVIVKDADGSFSATVGGAIDPGVPGRNGARQWTATIVGLQPASVYCYEVHDGTRTLARAGFRTAPEGAPASAARFIVFGDSGWGREDQRAVFTQLTTVPFELILHTGDLAYDDGTRAEFEANFFAIYAPLLRHFPIFPSSGNHEYRTENAAPFREVFALPENGGPDGRERWYSFDWGPVHFVAVDTELIGTTQASWLDRDLTANRHPWTVVYGHKPPFSSGTRGGDEAFRRFFVPILEKHRVSLVLSGHEHHYERSRPLDGITYVITGGGGRGTRPVTASPFTAYSEAVLHFLYVTVDGERLALHAIDAAGREFDSAVITR